MKIFIGNLPDGGIVKNEDVRPLFEQYGTVSEAEIVKNYGFVHMDSDEAGMRAITELNGYFICGRNMKVEKSESKGNRKRSQKLFVGNVADGTTTQQLRELFEMYSSVLEADVIPHKNYGFVHISANVERSLVNQIIRDLNGFNLNGNRIRVQLSTSSARQKPGMGGGDQCYRCGREGHWSKECSFFQDRRQIAYSGRGSYDGGGGGNGEGYGGRGGNSYGGGGGQYGRRYNPYPPPALPQYTGGQYDYTEDYSYNDYNYNDYNYNSAPTPHSSAPYVTNMYVYNAMHVHPTYPTQPAKNRGGPGPMKGSDPYAEYSRANYNTPVYSTAIHERWPLPLAPPLPPGQPPLPKGPPPPLPKGPPGATQAARSGYGGSVTRPTGEGTTAFPPPATGPPGSCTSASA